MSWSAIANINAPPPAGAKAVPAGASSSSSTSTSSTPAAAAATSTAAKPSNNNNNNNSNYNNNNNNNNNNNKGERRNNNNNNNKGGEANGAAANGHAKKEGGKGFENGKEKQDKPASAAEIKLQAEIDAAGKQITTIKQQLETLSGELKIREKARSDVQREVTQVKNKLRELQGRKQKLFDQKKAVRDKIKQIQETRRARDEQIRDAKAALKLKKVHDSLEANLKQVDDEVAKLEAAMETTTLSIQEEKARVGQIANFRKTKDEIRAYHALVETLTQEADNKQLGDQLRAFDTEINSFKGRESELTKELDRLRGKLDSKDADVPTLLNQRRTLFADLDTAHQAQTQARAALQKLRRDLYNQRQAARAAREAENKAYVAAKKDEERKRQEQREAAELLVVPLADEIALCDSLIQYLQPYKPVAAAAPAAAATTTTAAAAAATPATTSTGGDAAIRKMAAELGDGAEVVVLRGKGSAGGRAGGNKSAKRTAARNGGKINHHITTFGDFHRLSLLPPATIADVDATLELLQKKKAEFQQQSAEKMAARASALAAKKAAAAAAPLDTPAAAAPAADKPIAGDEDGDLLAMFQAADTNKSGQLSREEFTAVLSKLAQFDTPEKVAAAVAKADKNGDGKITYAEYVALANDDD